MDLIYLLGLLFAAGFIVKLTDDLLDKPNNYRKFLPYLLAVAYGAMLALGIHEIPEFAAISVGVIIGLFAAAKLDRAHIIGVATMVLVALYLGVPQIDIPLAILFLVAAIADEVMSDGIDNLLEKRKHLNKFTVFFFRERMILPVVCALVAIYYMNINYALPFYLFQAGYMLAERIRIR
jgi:hypothetical protein